MTCLPENVYAAYSDRELAVAETAEVERHLAECEPCFRLMASLSEENNMLTLALEEAPALREKCRLRKALTVAASVGVCALARALIVSPPPVAVSLLMSQLLYAARWLDYLAAGLLCVSALFLAVRFGRIRYISASLLLLVFLAAPSFAITRRTDRNLVLVSPGETIDDTVIATSDTVRVDGIIQGDLIAFARRVEVKGTIKGSLITFSQTVDLSGEVGRSLYSWAETVNLAPGSRVGFEVLIGGRSVMLNGEVSHGVFAMADNLMGRGSVGRDLEFYGNEVVLDQAARIAGRATLHVDDKNRVKIPSGVGVVEIEESRSRFASLSFYLRKLLRLIGALLVAWFAWRLSPEFFDACVRSIGIWWRSLGIGLAAAVLLPIAIVLAAITRVGFPLATVVLGILLAALYLAKIIVGAYIGRLILPRHALPARLALGLVIITVAVELPLHIGIAASIVVLAAGTGAFTYELTRRLTS